jgi:hypothetical protein
LNTLDKISSPINHLPADYNAYCVFLPSGNSNIDLEEKIWSKLKEWGDKTGKNILVASWDISDETLIEVLKALQFNREQDKSSHSNKTSIRRPAIFLMNLNQAKLWNYFDISDDKRISYNRIDISYLNNAFVVIIDDKNLMKEDITALQEVIIYITDALLVGEKEDAKRDGQYNDKIKSKEVTKSAIKIVKLE